MKKQYLLFRLSSILLAATLLLTPYQTWQALAQSPNEISWTTPVNLSNSGLTTAPGLVSDQNGNVHVVWNDNTLGTMYSRLEEGVWSPAVAIRTPFSETAPVFVDGGGYIHAFWRETNGNSLNHSRVVSNNFGGGVWERAKVLARGVEDFKVVYQADNTLHLAYLTSLEDSRNQAGAYYLRSVDGGVRWDSAKPIYTSRYFRALDPALSNVDIAATVQDGNQAVYITWNNPALKRVFLSQSSDGGVTWGSPFEVDGPSVTNATSSPYNPLVTVSGQDVLLVWQANLQSGFACSQYYQFSRDGGATWSERSRMLTEFVGCAQENSFLGVDPELTLLQTVIQDEVYLLAWNGEMWSKAYLQSTLTGFNDPLTNEPVIFRCRQSNINLGTTLFVVGCNDQGNEDIWVTSRAIGTVESWFPTATLWDDPVMVVESAAELSSAQAIVDDYGSFHLLWLQVDETGEDVTHRSVHYVRFKDDNLTQPARILVSPDKVVADFSVAYDRSRDRLVVVWTAGTTGEIYYSWADISRAASTFEWSKAVALPEAPTLAKSINLLVTPDGTIHVAYAIPVNEDRGIYLVSSTDGGVTWGQTTQLYQVSDPDWQAIDYPKLASTGDEILHVVWRRERIFGESGLVGVYYTRSLDRGQTWSAPQIVSNELSQGVWLLDAASNGVHRFWLSSVSSESTFFHDASLDQGANWRVQDNLTGLGENPGIASPFTDSMGEVNFVQAVEKSPGNLVINHQIDDGVRWSVQDSLMLGDASIDQITAISAQDLATGRLVLAYIFNEPQPAEGDLPYRLYLAAQSQEAVRTTATAAARQATQTPLVTEPVTTLEATSPAETPAPTESITPPTPQVPLSTGMPDEQVFAMDTTTGLALSGGLAVLVVVVFFLYTRLRRP